ncbi:hypothetical protein Tco_0903612 [Tanacetum coccineum]
MIHDDSEKRFWRLPYTSVHLRHDLGDSIEDPYEEAAPTVVRAGTMFSRCRVDIPRADTPYLGRGLILILLGPVVRLERVVLAAASSEFCTRHHDAQTDRAAVRAEIEILRRERLAYEQEGMETRQALARSEAHCRALEARVTALEAGASVDTLEDTGSSS